MLINPTNELDIKEHKDVLYRIKFIQSEDLNSTIKIYRGKLYDIYSYKSGVEVEDNVVEVSDYISPIAYYKSQSFITNAQFDYTYFDYTPKYVYEIHIPEGLEYSINK